VKAAILLAGLAVAGCNGDGFEKARAIDGDTLSIRSRHVRLYGIDAPELSQTCANQYGQRYSCGRDSMAHLADLLQERVRCRTVATDAYGRDVATCETAAGLDVARSQVISGNAVAYLRYSNKYFAEQIEAKKAKAGIWRGTFVQPEDFRHSAEKRP